MGAGVAMQIDALAAPKIFSQFSLALSLRLTSVLDLLLSL